jgi:hypothetical protein
MAGFVRTKTLVRAFERKKMSEKIQLQMTARAVRSWHLAMGR